MNCVAYVKVTPRNGKHVFTHTARKSGLSACKAVQGGLCQWQTQTCCLQLRGTYADTRVHVPVRACVAALTKALLNSTRHCTCCNYTDTRVHVPVRACVAVLMRALS